MDNTYYIYIYIYIYIYMSAVLKWRPGVSGMGFHVKFVVENVALIMDYFSLLLAILMSSSASYGHHAHYYWLLLQTH